MFTRILVYLYACFLVYLYTRYKSCIYTRILDSRGLQCDALVLNQPLSPLSLVLKNWKRVSKKWDLGTFNSKGITCVWVPVNHICCCLVCLFICWSYQIFWHAWILISSFWRNDCTKERPDLGVTCLLTIPKIPDVTSCRKALQSKPAPEGITRCTRAPELSWLLDAAGLGTLFCTGAAFLSCTGAPLLVYW